MCLEREQEISKKLAIIEPKLQKANERLAELEDDNSELSGKLVAAAKDLEKTRNDYLTYKKTTEETLYNKQLDNDQLLQENNILLQEKREFK